MRKKNNEVGFCKYFQGHACLGNEKYIYNLLAFSSYLVLFPLDLSDMFCSLYFTLPVPGNFLLYRSFSYFILRRNYGS